MSTSRPGTGPTKEEPKTLLQIYRKKLTYKGWLFGAPLDDLTHSMPSRSRWLLRPSMFFMVSSACIFSVAAYAINLDTDYYLKKLESDISNSPSAWFVDNTKLRHMKESAALDRIHNTAKVVYAFLQTNLSVLPNFALGMLSTCVAGWCHPGLFAVTSPEWFLATLLLMPWPSYLVRESKYLRPWLIQHCMHTITSGKSYTMLTSVFSYGSFSYLVFVLGAAPIANICASSWFMHSSQLQSTYESTPTFHMTAFFLSAGMFSLFSSRILNYARFKTLKCLEKPFKSAILVPPLRSSANPFRHISGASGVIYASITLAACEWDDKIYHTDARFGSTAIAMSDLWKIWCAVEGIFMVMGVGPINWAAHICGAAYGALYQQYGPTMWLWLRRTLHCYS